MKPWVSDLVKCCVTQTPSLTPSYPLKRALRMFVAENMLF